MLRNIENIKMTQVELIKREKCQMTNILDRTKNRLDTADASIT